MSFPETAVSVQIRESDRKTPSRRSELEIKMDVLQVVSTGIDRPTQIMYKANLSWIALQSNLKELVKRSLLKEEDLGSRKRYELTQTGFELLSTFRKVIDALNVAPIVQSPTF